MDGDFRINLEEVLRNIYSAEIISIYFPLLRKTILIDTRFSDDDPPMIKIVPMALTIGDRNRVLRKLRPNFPKSRSLTVIPWPKYVESLVDLGIWSKVMERFVDSGNKEVIQECKNVIEEMYDIEMEELSAVIRGENYHTMWSRP